jgi:hypothetical protein
LIFCWVTLLFRAHWLLVTIEVFLILLFSCFTLIKVFSVAQLEKLKGLPILLSDIIYSRKTIKIVYKMKHLFISLIVVKWYDWDSIIDLKSKAVHRVINYYHIFQIPISEDPKIFDIVPL